MLFWLNFIQQLPSLSTINIAEYSQQKLNQEMEEFRPNEQTILAQKIPTITTISQPLTPAQLNIGSLGNIGFFGALIGFLVLLALIALWAYTRVYVITPNNEAFVRTGGVFVKDKTVILNGGCIVIPGFHELTRVPLREISIDVVRQGNLAVRTKDYLRANMRVTFYVCISADKDSVLTAAQRLSKQGKISESDIKDALEKRADDAIRSAAKKKSIAEIDSDKLGFADEVLNLIQQDLRKVGLTLNNIAISEIEESDTYDENNFFDAQGVRLRTETIQKSIKQKMDVELETEREKKEIELNTRVAIEQQELQAEKQSLTIAKEKEEAKLSQMKEIEFLKAQRQREIQETRDQEAAKIERNKILQEQAVEEEKIKQKLAIQQKEIESSIALEEQNKQLKVAQALQQQEAEIAEIHRQQAIEQNKILQRKNIESEQIKQKLAVQQSEIEANITLEEQNKQLKVAQTLQQQEAEVAEINRRQTVEASRLRAQISIAEAEQESSIAQQQTAIAIANKEKERLYAEAEKAQAEAGVQTAKDVENAEREKRLSMIAAEREAQEKRISEQNVVEIDVFRRRRQAEIGRQAAELEAESIRTLAEAQRYKAMAEAEGKLALIQAENALSDANRTADLIKALWPQLAPYLPEIIKALAPQPGVLGDARIYAFPGVNGNNGNGVSSASDINKLLLSTSGLALINTLLDEGKLGTVVNQIKELLKSDEKTIPNPQIKANNTPNTPQSRPSTTPSKRSQANYGVGFPTSTQPTDLAEDEEDLPELA
jgi:uncharacterized membrane protein YqiK